MTATNSRLSNSRSSLASVSTTGFTPDINQLIAQISQAHTLEQAGNIEAAKELYWQVVESDPNGSLGTSARRALDALEIAHPAELRTKPVEELASFSPRFGSSSTPAVESLRMPEPKSKGLWSRLANLPVRGKQYVGLFSSELFSVFGLAGLSMVLLVTSSQTQLRSQAESELAVNDINYNIKINQMGFGFRGQSDNAAVIAAASAYSNGEELSPELKAQVEAILRNEISARRIEYATLVGADRRIIASANADRRGEAFDPDGLVTAVLANPEQIKTSEIVSWEDLTRENPPLPEGLTEGEDALVRYTVTPVRAEGRVVGALVSGDIVNQKFAIAANTVNAFDGGYSAVYQVEGDGDYVLSTAFVSDSSNDDSMQAARTAARTDLDRLELPDVSILERAIAAEGEIVTAQAQRIGDAKYTLAASALTDFSGNPVAVMVRGTPEATAGALVRRNIGLQAGIAVLAVGMDFLLAGWLTRSFVRPIKKLIQATKDFAKGDRTVRAEVIASDEIGALTQNFNEMAANIGQQEQAMAEQSQQRQAEADFQRQEKEQLQREVVQLLLDIEGAREGDLTVRAKVDSGEMGSVGDAFNATVRNLQDLVSKVQTTSEQVQTSANQSEESVQKLAREATNQARAILTALTSVEGMSQSIQTVAESAQEAADIAHLTLEATQEGEATMDQTVSSIDNIRNSAAETSKKVKRLAESSQEISKIVGIISSISEKTNLLAFNASIEAARAGENGQGFRIVADEVRRLAERVTESTKEIEQLVTTIQAETGDVLQQMEASTTHVVEGTQLVSRTKSTLQRLASISQKADELLQSISRSTESQTAASAAVTQTMQEVVAIAQNTSAESQEMSESLQELVGVASNLQASVSKFQVEAQ
ncbi:methyl-accepting chemotaxis protein [Synechococcus sp. PCC 7336]|uniref:methyl-accepting chemotaxis protein n=1 Tax=Synechococcus sp. PCC 7336 TaxID=195250 RepID=UPI000349A84A|nr:HAMP domain-containing methyl-accepting chemotaxis protein [Synechococcus sp. PCC 7336]